MGFEVDTDALRSFAEFLDGYATDADLVGEFIDDKLEMETHGEGILNQLSGRHYDNTYGMKKRIRTIGDVASHGSSEISETATYVYDEMDKEKAAALDAEYPGPKDKNFTPPDSSGKGSFKYHSIDNLKIEKDPDDLEPKSGDIEDEVQWWIDRMSYMRAIREFINWAFGGDPIDWLIQAFIGEWRAWAKCALAWEVCGEATKDIADNLDPGLNKLQEVWKGKAADAAVEYFVKFQEATKTESKAFEWLYKQYKLIVEFTHELQGYISNLINTAIDLAIDAVLFISGGGTIIAIKDIIGLIGMTISLSIDLVRMAETVIEAWKMEDPPEFEVPDLPGQGKPPNYDHPSSV